MKCTRFVCFFLYSSTRAHHYDSKSINWSFDDFKLKAHANASGMTLVLKSKIAANKFIIKTMNNPFDFNWFHCPYDRKIQTMIEIRSGERERERGRTENIIIEWLAEIDWNIAMFCFEANSVFLWLFKGTMKRIKFNDRSIHWLLAVISFIHRYLFPENKNKEKNQERIKNDEKNYRR